MQLLLSVRHVGEAIEAATAGAHIIDVTGPTAGTLGRPAPGVVHAIRAAVPDALPLSVALGDGPFEPREVSAAAVSAADEGAAFDASPMVLRLKTRSPSLYGTAAGAAARAVPATVPRGPDVSGDRG
jgi:uncharacterized protein (UPF0264 family)